MQKGSLKYGELHNISCFKCILQFYCDPITTKFRYMEKKSQIELDKGETFTTHVSL